ncbi:MAG: YbjN domain-containing protein [Chlamydiales bacterium]
MSFSLDPAGLDAFLKKHGLEPQIEAESGQLYISRVHEGQEIYTFMTIAHAATLFQIMTYFPIALQKTSLNDTARLLHLFNRDVDMPGFCIDEKLGLIFYRSVLPSFNKTLEERVVMTYLGAHKGILETFFTPVVSVVLGQLKVEDVLKS